MKEYKVNNHVSSMLPENKNWKLFWNDEFDGDTLDETKWGYRLDFWGKHSPTFSKKGVSVKDGSLHIGLVKEGENYYSAHLQTGSLTFDIPKDSDGFWPFGKMQKPKFMHKYGYYEIRCRLPKNQGWHAAFWLQAPGIGTHPDVSQCGVECDIMENYNQHTDGVTLCGNGYGGYGKDSKWPGHFKVPYIETIDGWHTYAVDWNKNGYIFYADGNEVGRQCPPECPVSDVEQFILVSTECHGYHRGFGHEAENTGLAGDSLVWQGSPVEELKKAVLPDEFTVDYVRVFDEV